MSINTHIRIERKSEVQQRTGWPRSTLHSRILEGLFTPPISLGARAVGWPEHETTAIISAMIAGKSKDDIKALVASLIVQRQETIGGGL